MAGRLKSNIIDQNKKWISLFALLFAGLSANAHLVGGNINQKDATVSNRHQLFQPVIAPLKSLQTLGYPIQIKDSTLDVGISFLNEKQREQLSLLSHQSGKCGGYELLPAKEDWSIRSLGQELETMSEKFAKDQMYARLPLRSLSLEKRAEIDDLISQVNEDRIRADVEWFSGFPTRYNRGSSPNRHVQEFKSKLETMLKGSVIPTQIEQISHTSTSQMSTRVRLLGKTRPNEIIVLGGHYDSINQSWGGDRAKAPGADDNASGSSNLLEALRILIAKGQQPERTIEFYWYAGEESGLLGSAEIAKQYKSQSKDVVAVLQLDMTAYPGEGEFVIGNVTDNTSPWLHDLFREINRLYLGVRLVEDKCGYGCSDHASWYRQGYSTLLPFEATTHTMNPNIHSNGDQIANGLNFKHAAVFSKLALAFAYELANSNLRQ